MSKTLHIPYVNLAAQHKPLKKELLNAIGDVIDSGQFILGEQVAEFEQKFADICGVSHAIGVNSGTDALIFALKILHVKPGDEIVTVPNSFVASTTCIRILGASPVFVDVLDNYTIDSAKLAQAITPRTKAILPVHLTGHPCDMEAIMEIAHAHGIPVVEDCAQAVNAKFNEQHVGSFGQIGCFSLHPLKTLNACGDAGILTTNDPAMYEQLRIMRNLGLKTRSDAAIWSTNSRMDTIQAAVLLVKLRYLNEWTDRRRENARFYRSHLADLPQVQTPQETDQEWAVYHTFVIQADQRDALKHHLENYGIGTGIHYPLPIHLTTAGRPLGYSEGSFPVTERQAGRILSLPIYPELTTEKIDYICDRIRNYYQ